LAIIDRLFISNGHIRQAELPRLLMRQVLPFRCKVTDVVPEILSPMNGSRAIRSCARMILYYQRPFSVTMMASQCGFKYLGQLHSCKLCTLHALRAVAIADLEPMHTSILGDTQLHHLGILVRRLIMLKRVVASLRHSAPAKMSTLI
jgi:hypothetical protein